MKKYRSLVNKVIDRSDIVLEVVDARFIEETRNLKLEEQIIDSGKTLIYVINKSDLVKSRRGKAAIAKLSPRVVLSAKERQGGRKLRDLIKRFSHKEDETYVGIIGYPNTGKSSIINLLVGSGSAKAAPQSGHTRGYQMIRLTRDIMLIDTPGVYEPRDTEVNVLVSAIDFTKVQDPDHYVELIFERFPGVLEKHYQIKDLEDFARKRNFLKKGGVLDDERAAREILKDWQQGRITV